MTNTPNLISMNVQCLGNKRKRLDTFNFIQNKQPSVIVLQGTNFTDRDKDIIYSEIEMKCFLITIVGRLEVKLFFFINNSFNFNLISQYKDTNGNLLILTCMIFDKKIIILLMYMGL